MGSYNALKSTECLRFLSFFDPPMIITTYMCAIIGYMTGNILEITVFGAIFAGIPALLDAFIICSLITRREGKAYVSLYLILAAVLLCFISDVSYFFQKPLVFFSSSMFHLFIPLVFLFLLTQKMYSFPWHLITKIYF
eukprot:Phypoly_transcript_14708.p1 GENE.Phypoly_transcript_14708~~Phypoly_transcript_14708.p1  ORF type:complete len:160 (+),score=6.20 Phypoly_transcript_14708:68-481(+)